MTTKDETRDLIEKARAVFDPHEGKGSPVLIGWIEALADALEATIAAPDHQAEAPSDGSEYIETLNRVWHHQLDVLGAARDIAALAARPVVDDAAVERAMHALGIARSGVLSPVMRRALLAALETEGGEGA